MKVNENILREALRDAIADVENRPSTFVKKVKTTMSHMFNITGGETAFILNGRTPVDTMSDSTMYKVAVVLHELISNDPSSFNTDRLDVNNYYTDDEIKAYSKKIDRKVVDKDIVFTQWIQVAKDQYVVTISNKELTRLVAIGKIHYNPETQRSLTVIDTGNNIIKKVTLFESALDSICANMKSEDYIADALTFNVNPDLYAVPKISGNDLIVPSGSVIDCIDGYHRLKSAVIVTKLEQDWEQNFIIVLTVFDVKKAKKYILQENYKNHLSEEQVKEYDQDDAANFIIDKLRDSIYLKDSKLSNISYQLNNIINSIFKPDKLKSIEARQNALILYKNIEKCMNELIEENGLIGKVFSLEEWFVYLYIINFCINNNSDFMNVIYKIDINDILSQIKITKKPVTEHYKIMSEVIKDVQSR